MKRIGLSFAMAVGLFAGVTTIDVPEAIAQSNTTGSVRGRIVDKKTKDPVIGATVSISGAALQGTQSEITDENGAFNISSLPPGTYVVAVFYGDSQFNRPNVVIEVGKQAFINVPIDTSVKANEVIELVGRAPLVDQGSTKVGSTITEEYTRNIPTGRTFGAVLGTAPGTQGDQYGVSFSGSTSVESSYVVEGINTTDTAFGGQSTNLPNEFVEETEVIAGGYSAEFGRSTGGVINVVTKQGSNKFKGSIFAYYTPGSLTADAKSILREGSAIGSETNLDYQTDLGFEVGGPIIKDKLWFHVGYNPSFTGDTLSRITSSQQDADGNGEVDVDPDTGFTVLNEVARQDRGRFQRTQFFTAKINGAISDNHQFQISGFGNPRTIDKTLYRVTGSPDAQLYKIADGAYDVAAKWTSKLNDGKTQIDVVGGYHLGFEDQDPYFSNGEGAAGLQLNRNALLGDLQQYEVAKSPGCVDGSADDMYPLIDNCPVVNYTFNGLGFLESRDNARTSITGAVTQRVNLAGHHAFKLGGDLEFTTYDSFRRWTGGSFYQLRTNNRWRQRSLLELDPTGSIDCLETPAGNTSTCSVANGGINANTENRNIGLYLQDSWQIRPNFTVNAGVRWEKQTAYVANGLGGTVSPEGETIPDVAFDLSNMIAPRIGFIWDPTSEGRSKFIAHYGRFYESVPMDINVRAFGGEITDLNTFSSTVCPEIANNPDATVAQFDDCATRTDSRDPLRSFQLGGGTEYVAPSMRGQYINEVILGAEYELMADFKMGINFVGRNMPIVIEDVSTDGGNNYLIANPGEDFSDDAASLRSQADSIMATDPDLAALYNSRADQLDSVKDFDKPVRDYQAIQVTAQQRFSKHSMVLASYTYARSKGNYPGLFSTETGQLDPNLTSLYDLPELMSNRYGALGLDRPHNLKVDGFYQFDFKQAGLLTLGASVRGQSGIAHNTLGAHVFYGTDESYILPRGSDLRSPFTWTGDIKATYGRRINKTQSVEIFADIFNLFDNQDETDADETYTFDAIDPIVGGDSSDLVHAKQQGVNETANLNKNYGNLNARQSPRTIRFGLRYSF